MEKRGRGSLLKKKNSWLKDEEQRVEVNNEFSWWREVTSRIPQGLMLRSWILQICVMNKKKINEFCSTANYLG